MFERFTDQARQAVVAAQVEARALQHNYIGTEHLLLGLLSDPADLPARVLARHDIALANAREQVEEIIGESHDTTARHLPFTPRAKTILEMALREAQQLRQDHVGSGHLLLALIHEGQGVAPQVLVRLGATLAEVETDMLQQLPQPDADTAASLRERVLSPQQPHGHQTSAELVARLDSLDEKLTEIAARLEVIEHRLTDQ